LANTERSLRLSERVEPEEFKDRVAAVLGDLSSGAGVHHDQVWAKIEPANLVAAVRKLKEDESCSCEFFTFLSAIDWEDDGLEVVIALFSYRWLSTIVLKVALPPGRPELPSITGIYGGADWHEREAAEMFGITFDGHPNPVKLYLPEDFEGHPLLKSFRLASRVYKEWPGAKDPDEAKAGGR
jgi:NADH-quinone oxidoreductase subunit C